MRSTGRCVNRGRAFRASRPCPGHEGLVDQPVPPLLAGHRRTRAATTSDDRRAGRARSAPRTTSRSRPALCLGLMVLRSDIDLASIPTEQGSRQSIDEPRGGHRFDRAPSTFLSSSQRSPRTRRDAARTHHDTDRSDDEEHGKADAALGRGLGSERRPHRRRLRAGERSRREDRDEARPRPRRVPRLRAPRALAPGVSEETRRPSPATRWPRPPLRHSPRSQAARSSAPRPTPTATPCTRST